MDGSDWEKFIKYYCIVLRNSIARLLKETYSDNFEEQKILRINQYSLLNNSRKEDAFPVNSNKPKNNRAKKERNPMTDSHSNTSSHTLSKETFINSSQHCNSEHLINQVANVKSEDLGFLLDTYTSHLSCIINRSKETPPLLNPKGMEGFYEQVLKNFHCSIPTNTYGYIAKNVNLIFNLACNLTDPVFIMFLNRDSSSVTILSEYISFLIYNFIAYSDSNIIAIKNSNDPGPKSQLVDLATIMFSLVTNCDISKLSLLKNDNDWFKLLLQNIAKEFDLDLVYLINQKHSTKGMMKISYSGKIIDFDDYMGRFLLQQNITNYDHKSINDFVCRQNMTLFKNQFKNGVLDFSNGVIQSNSKLTIKIFPDQVVMNELSKEEEITSEAYEEIYLLYLNQMKTLDVRFTTLIGVEQVNDMIEEVILVEAQLSKERQNFDMDLFSEL